MIESTFIHCQGVGATTERSLWEAGVTHWSEAANEQTQLPVGPVTRQRVRETSAESIGRLANADFRWFASRLPEREHWRMVRATGVRIGYVDIETNGGYGPQDLTVVGLYDGLKVRHFVKGDNLAEFPEAIEGFNFLVTFFGTGFDLPFLKRSFGMSFPQPHTDLCFALKRLGYKGGLKSVERQLGLRRSGETTGLDGMDAVRLWYEYLRGKEKSLATLLKYNEEDIVNLETLLNLAYPRLEALTRSGFVIRGR